MSKPLGVCTIPNRHIESCGAPPDIDRDTVKYLSYFENELGEQFVFVVRNDKSAELWAGDAGWAPLAISQGQPGILMSPEERAWFDVCWKVSKYRRE
jgi:hypothetical protein